MFFLKPSTAISSPAKGVVKAAKTPSKLLAMTASFLGSPSILDVPQVFLAQPEVMADFVKHDLPDPLLDLILRGGDPLDRLLVDDDAVGGEGAAISTSVLKRNAVIKSEQGARRAAGG